MALLALAGCSKKSWNEIPALELSSPAGEGSLLPNLSTSPQGTLVLSWVERAGEKEHALKYSVLENVQWSEPRMVAQGEHWFVNWADFPSVVAFDESHWAAHWLVKREGGEYAYDIALSVSNDGGKSWSAAVTPHTDGTLTEHGFVSLFPVGAGFAAVWLDGRETAGGADHDHHSEPGAGAMALRGVRVNFDGNLAEQLFIDERVCDCCQTTAAVTDRGVVVAYRNRTADEVRDISVAHLVGNEWEPLPGPKGDHWQIDGCPVNGPSIDARGNHVALAWFTAADNSPRVLLALSRDGADTFGDSILIDDNALGRVDVVVLMMAARSSAGSSPGRRARRFACVASMRRATQAQRARWPKLSPRVRPGFRNWSDAVTISSSPGPTPANHRGCTPCSSRARRPDSRNRKVSRATSRR
jgi:hypothetical protein